MILILSLSLFFFFWFVLITINGVSLAVKSLPAMRENRVQPLGQEGPLEKEMASHSLPGESHGHRSLVDYSPKGCNETGTTEWLTLSLFTLNELKSLRIELGTGWNENELSSMHTPG